MNRKVIVTCCVFLAGSAMADLADDVRCREVGFSESVEQGDMEAFRTFIDADARFVGASTLRGVDAVSAGWSVFFESDGPSIKWRPQIVEVLENGQLALSRGPYRVISKDADGKITESWGTFNSIWRINSDGEWRVVIDAGSPAAAAPDDETKALLDAEYSCS